MYINLSTIRTNKKRRPYMEQLHNLQDCDMKLYNLITVVPLLRDHSRERPPLLKDHNLRVPMHCNTKPPLVKDHLFYEPRDH